MLTYPLKTNVYNSIFWENHMVILNPLLSCRNCKKQPSSPKATVTLQIPPASPVNWQIIPVNFEENASKGGPTRLHSGCGSLHLQLVSSNIHLYYFSASIHK